MMPNMLERKLQLPAGAPPRLLHDIETYSALVELQTQLGASAPWYQRLA